MDFGDVFLGGLNGDGFFNEEYRDGGDEEDSGYMGDSYLEEDDEYS